VRIFGKRGQSLHSARRAENDAFAGQQTYALYVNPQIAGHVSFIRRNTAFLPGREIIAGFARRKKAL